METLWQDLRHAARRLRAAPSFTLVAALVLAIGIGANTALFSLVNSVLLRSPVADADQLVRVYETQVEKNVARTPVAPANFLAWRAQQTSFEEMAAYTEQTFTLSGGGMPESIAGARVSAGLCRVLRASPVVGRAFTADEDRPGGRRVVVLGERLWQRRFDSAQDAIGQTVRLNGLPHTVIGVLPAGAAFPDRDTELWVPAALDRESGLDGMGGRILSAIARLRPDE
jgi:putative ABC transport system permease protein